VITNEELDAEYRFIVQAFSDGVEEEVEKSLRKPLRSEQRKGFIGLVTWATRVAEKNESDSVLVCIEQVDDGQIWHQMMSVRVDQREAWIRVSGEFPRVII